MKKRSKTYFSAATLLALIWSAVSVFSCVKQQSVVPSMIAGGTCEVPPTVPKGYPPLRAPSISVARDPIRYGYSRPATPNNWTTVSDWWVDAANTTTCASDFNNCTSATCGGAGAGVGPCLSFAEITARWGTYEPIFRQTTTIHILSDDNGAGDSDNIYLNPISENQTFFEIQGDSSGDAVCSGVLGVVTSKNVATNTLLQVATITNCGPPSLGFGDLIVNSTHPSRAWVVQISNPNNGPWTISQPCAALTNPPTSSTPACTEVDTWTAGDSVSVFTPFAIRIGNLSPILERLGTTAIPGVLYNVSNGGVNDFNNFNKPSVIGGPVIWLESASQRFLTIDASSGFQSRTGFFNSVTDDIWGGKLSALATTAASSNGFIVRGGTFGPFTMTLPPGSLFDDDFIFAGSNSTLSGITQFASVANQSATASIFGGGLTIDGTVLVKAQSTSGKLYGIGNVNVTNKGHIDPVLVLTGTVSVTNNSASITFSTNQTITTTQWLVFASQPGAVYFLSTAISGSTSGTLTAVYSGTTNGSTTTSTDLTGTSWLIDSGTITIEGSNQACNGSAYTLPDATSSLFSAQCSIPISASNLSATTTQTLSGTVSVGVTALSGTVSVTNGSTAITFSGSQTLVAGSPITFGSHLDHIYYIASGATTAYVLTTQYAGTTNASTTASASPNSLTSITFSSNQTLAQGQQLIFASQPSVSYYLASSISGATAGVLTRPYSGAVNASTTAVTTNVGFGDCAWSPSGGSICSTPTP